MPKWGRWGQWLVSLWLVFTVSLATWWLVFGLRQVDYIRQLDHQDRDRLERSQTMLLMEGTVLIASVLLGGIFLFWSIRKEQMRNREKQEFFGAFTHDIKTSIASLRLQAESLQEDSGGKGSSLLQRLIQDSVRLQVQLENSLYLANLEGNRLLAESFSLRDAVSTVHYHWPDLEILLEKEVLLQGDPRAFESILRNLMQNCVAHARARVARISPISKDGKIHVECSSDGEPFSGDPSLLGQPFYQPGKVRGTGVGLFISKRLAEKMGGALEFRKDEAGRLVVSVVMRSA